MLEGVEKEKPIVRVRLMAMAGAGCVRELVVSVPCSGAGR